jgi:Ras-related protein Rab-5C
MKAKVILVGDSAVGKTSLILKYLSQSFSDDTTSTTSPVFFQVSLEVDDAEVNLEIWDTAGQENYRSLMSLYYRSAHIALLCITTESMESASEWASVVHSSEPACLIILVLTKSDLLSEEELNQIYNDLTQVSQTIRAEEFIVTSAKTGEGVQEAFIATARIARQIGISPLQNSSIFEKKTAQRRCCQV